MHDVPSFTLSRSHHTGIGGAPIHEPTEALVAIACGCSSDDVGEIAVQSAQYDSGRRGAACLGPWCM